MCGGRSAHIYKAPGGMDVIDFGAKVLISYGTPGTAPMIKLNKLCFAPNAIVIVPIFQAKMSRGT